MANALYDKGRNRFLTGDLDWAAGTFRVYLVDTAFYTVDLANDEFLSDVPAGARTAFGTLAGQTAVDGVADAADETLAAVAGNQSEALVICEWSGAAATSPLVAYVDTAGGLPITPNGSNVEIAWNASGVFAL